MRPDLEQIYLEYKDKVMAYIQARIRVRADAEDLCSDVFEKIAVKLDAYDPEKSSISTWVYAITRNTVIDHYRRTRPSQELDENLKDDSEVDEKMLHEESLSMLAGALKRLPQELRDIVVLHYYDGKPLTEVAQIMHMSYGAIKLRNQKALDMLRLAMGA